MDEELEKKIGKIVLSIFMAIVKVVITYAITVFILVFLFIVLIIFTFILVFFCFVIEKLTSIDTQLFRYSFGNISEELINLVVDTLVMTFDFFLKTKTGGFMLVVIILVISFFEYQKKCEIK